MNGTTTKNRDPELAATAKRPVKPKPAPAGTAAPTAQGGAAPAAPRPKTVRLKRETPPPTSVGTVVTSVVTTVQGAVSEHRRELLLIGALGSAAFTAVALVGWSAQDPTWAHPVLDATVVVTNPCGPLGANVADLLYRSIGYGAWAPVALGLVVPVYVLARRPLVPWPKALMSGWLWLMTLGFMELTFGPAAEIELRPGGLLGAWVCNSLTGVVGVVGASITLVATIVSTGGLLAGVSWSSVAHRVLGRVEAELPAVKEKAVAASGQVGGLAVGGAKGVGRGVFGLLVRIGDVSIGSVKGMFRGANTVVARAKDAVTRTDADEDDGAWSASGLIEPERAKGAVLPVLAQVPAFAGPDTEVDDDTAPSAEVAWEPTRAEAGQVLQLFPELGRRRKGDGPHAEDMDEPVRVARRAPVAPAAAPALADVAATPRRPTRRAKVVVAAVHEPRTLAPADDSDVDDDEVETGSFPAVVSALASNHRPEDDPFEAIDPANMPTTAEHRPVAMDIRVEPASGLQTSPKTDDGQSVSDRGSLFFELPPLSLLDPVPEQTAYIDEDALRRMAGTVEEALASFKVTGKVTDVRVGPVVTIFEFQPDPGIMVRRVSNLADDLAMVLKARSVRVVAPIPGKGVVGIEIPSQDRLTIYLRELLASTEFRTSDADLPVVLGKDVEGRPVVDDLAKMPHLLVGGTTGSGKSVGVNAMLMSLLYTRTPEELRLILVDPKKLEFEAYSGVPHLLHPVITDPQIAAAALAWACREMDRRYELLARWGTRNISGYNKKVARELKSWSAEKARSYAPADWPDEIPPPKAESLPFIVIVIDELADLMMVAKKDVQDSIVRLTQMARACGMHLICATQRPSVDVVTGLIKANMPTRIAFKLRSVIDSRTILDQGGAEKLLGRGDLLWLPGAGEVRRVHGPFVSDDEVHRLIAFLRAQRDPEYIETLRPVSSGDGEDALFDDPEMQDDLYDQALQIVVEKGKASTSMVQRHLKIGYNRAARLIDAMEAAGVVGPADGARPREVLLGQR